MNYYERHIGDYIKDTVALTMLEDGAYNRLIDQCYQTEQPLPLERKEIYREARANTASEKKAVDYVIGKYFDRTDEGYIQKRVQGEIARYQDKQAKAKRSADARWNNHRSQSDGNANASQPHDASDDAPGMRTHSERNALQTPDTNHQTPKKKKPTALSPAKLPTCRTQDVIDLYHEILPDMPSVRLHTRDRVRAIRNVWDWVLTSEKPDHTRRAETAEQALEWFRSYFERATDNDFLMGRNRPSTGEHANWRCDLDFLLTDRGMKHVIEKTQLKAVA